MGELRINQFEPADVSIMSQLQTFAYAGVATVILSIATAQGFVPVSFNDAKLCPTTPIYSSVNISTHPRIKTHNPSPVTTYKRLVPYQGSILTYTSVGYTEPEAVDEKGESISMEQREIRRQIASSYRGAMKTFFGIGLAGVISFSIVPESYRIIPTVALIGGAGMGFLVLMDYLQRGKNNG